MAKKIYFLFLLIIFAGISLFAYGYLKKPVNDPIRIDNAQSQQDGNVQTATFQTKEENQPPAPEENLLLPDIRIEPLIDPNILMSDAGRKLLRFPGTFTNIGDGPLELIGKEDPETDTTEATQRIFKKEGDLDERLVGNFVVHPTHNHWHFENFVEFELYSLKEDDSLNVQLLTTGKMTFCIHDFAPSKESLPGKPERQVYPQCISEVQGISVGWADTYQSHVSGQELDITDIPDGHYAFHATADPENRIAEKNENNNSSTSYIEIKGNAVEILTAP